LLRLSSRPYMFTASPSPASIASVRAALAVIAGSDEHRVGLWRNARVLHDEIAALGFDICAGVSPIIAVRLDGQDQAFAIWRRLIECGVYTNLAIPPGTPNGISMLRCSVSAAHTDAQIEAIVAAFGQVAGEFGFERPEHDTAMSAVAEPA
jgi:8-amino-7-oxononanoate synthase